LFPNRSHVPEKVSLSELMTGVDLKPTLCMVSCFFPSCCQRTPEFNPTRRRGQHSLP
jgi:hypothetical protein